MTSARSSSPVSSCCIALLLAGCAPEGFRSQQEWQMACVRQGGEPMIIKVYNGSSYVCIRKDALIEVKK